ncbi:MAG: methylmalonyl-CoA epimerase [Candidatus Tectomicrobia bacterium]|uniref:Methylmalonyl-CoA epimerase n=1 Tax=Tectimicrobiota bacterium TaxID=2528274 RepID=A0A932HZY9_UNCTE|nr:methylmalonyl-CoA epimerase [Candidatus Tectomicrobia bacterium]
MFNKIHHIGIAVKDMDAAIALYQKMGAKLLAREKSRDGGADLAMMDLGGDLIEPISPLRDDTSLARFIRERGEGLHHVAYDVKNIEGVIAQMKAQGFQMIDEKSRPGFGGHLVAFIQPKSTMGTLWELVEDI